MSTQIPPRIRHALEQARAAKLARAAPDEAFSDLLTHEVDNDWLGSMQATNDQIANAMRRWFLERYCDPAVGTPYSSDMGESLKMFTTSSSAASKDWLTKVLIGAVVNELVSDQWPNSAPVCFGTSIGW